MSDNRADDFRFAENPARFAVTEKETLIAVNVLVSAFRSLKKIGVGRFGVALPKPFGNFSAQSLRLDFALLHRFFNLGYFRVQLINIDIVLVVFDLPVFLAINGDFFRKFIFLGGFSANEIAYKIEPFHFFNR